MTTNTKDYVNWFRHSSPYINAHRGKTFVLMISGDAIEDPNFGNIIHDIALFNSLGVRLVIAFGARPQIERRFQQQNKTCNFHLDVRITDAAALAIVKEAVGTLRIEIEALLSMRLANSPMHLAQIDVASGNYVTAKPKGVINGIDYQHTGQVRKIDTAAIQHNLVNGAIVLLSPVGYSPTGEVFNLALEDLATQAAIQLQADKLIVFGNAQGICDEQGNLLREISLGRAQALQNSLTPKDDLYKGLQAACEVCQAGISRCHFISYQKDGALIEELFSRDGSGTLLGQQDYEAIRLATIDDVGGIIELITPLENDGVLVKRSRELLESEINRFTVVERDGTVIACAALYPFADGVSGELACVVTHPDYRKGHRAANLLTHIEKQAAELKLQKLFVLTTQTAHWFIEQGFQPTQLDALPQEKQQLYNLQRNSKIFVKIL